MRTVAIALILAIGLLLAPIGLPPDAAAQVSAGFSCVISADTADAVCKTAPGSGLRFYVTDVVVSNGGTAQTVRIITGTGTTCGTSTDVVVPSLNMPVNGSLAINLRVPVQTAVNEDLCADISGTTAYSVWIVGQIAP